MSDVVEPRLCSAAEAILIVADEPVTTAAIAQALGLEDRLAEDLLEDLAAEYRGERPGARGLIEEAGAETSGAILYRTTGEFLEYLGIDSLDELPPLAPYLPRVEALGEIVEQADELAGRRTP